MPLIVIVGGQKAGKSSHAMMLAGATGSPVTVVAPARVEDPEMAERIARHRADRPAHVATVETFDLQAALSGLPPDATVVVDALDTWLAEAMAEAGLFSGEEVASLGPSLAAAADELVDGLGRWATRAAERSGWTIVVAGEPGLGLHGTGADARRYVDLHGRCLQRLGEVALEVRRVVAGRVQVLPAQPPPPPITTNSQVAPGSRSISASGAPGAVAWVDRPAPTLSPGPAADPAGLQRLIDAVGAVDGEVVAAARQHLSGRAVPPGSLGRLGELAARLAGAAGRMPPPVPERPALVVAAADHGVHRQAVGPWPRTVSRAIVQLLAEGQAGACAGAATVGARLAVLDVGLAEPVADHPRLVRSRVVDGTDDLTVADALTREQAVAAVLRGAELADRLMDEGADLLITGDVGITNTTASAALIAACTGCQAAECTGPGTGLDAGGLRRKVALVEQAVSRLRASAHEEASPAPSNDAGGRVEPLRALCGIGGAEHAATVGMLLAAAARRVPVVLDGIVSGAAGLVAVGLAPVLADHLVAGHRSPEPGATVALDHLGLEPLLELELALGEGSGGVLAVPLVQAAARILHDVAGLEDLDLSEGNVE